MSETAFKKQVLGYLKREYPNIWIYKTCDRFTVGIPDLIFCLNGKFYALELKFGKGKPTPMQVRNVRKIIEAGGIAKVVWTLAEVKEILKTKSL